MAKNEEKKDTILSLYRDIKREIKINEEFRAKETKRKIKDAKREIRNILKATRGMKGKQRLAFVGQPMNLLKMLQGDDYYFTISDGFGMYRIKKSTIERHGEDTTSYILKRYRNNINKAIKVIRIDKERSKASKAKAIDILERLKRNVSGNIDIINRRAGYVWDTVDMNKLNDEIYPIFQNVVGLSIMINI